LWKLCLKLDLSDPDGANLGSTPYSETTSVK